MQTSTFKFVLAALFVLVALAGCATTETPILDQHFGDAVNAAKAQQTLNPDASQNTEPVVGMEGQATRGAMDNYHKSYEQPPVQTMSSDISINTGSSSSNPGGN